MDSTIYYDGIQAVKPDEQFLEGTDKNGLIITKESPILPESPAPTESSEPEETQKPSESPESEENSADSLDYIGSYRITEKGQAMYAIKQGGEYLLTVTGKKQGKQAKL